MYTWLIDWLMFNANFSNISAILWRELILLLNLETQCDMQLIWYPHSLISKNVCFRWDMQTKKYNHTCEVVLPLNATRITTKNTILHILSVGNTQNTHVLFIVHNLVVEIFITAVSNWRKKRLSGFFLCCKFKRL